MTATLVMLISAGYLCKEMQMLTVKQHKQAKVLCEEIIMYDT